MRNITLQLLLFCISISFATASEKINLTPTPKQMTVGEGELVIPQSFTIATGTLSEECCYEAEKFAKHFSDVTGYSIKIEKESNNALITMSQYSGNEELGNEGYTLDILSNRIDIAAGSAAGFYFAFQSIKKLLPACVMAGVKDTSVTTFALPQLSIVDAPRFEYRGFMLDVARHYFEKEEIKRMLDVMSYYKMNRFHWHLVDDQGWRIQIDKYPKLTTIGATRSNSWSNDPIYGRYYTNEPYGPYFYSKEDAQEIVAYAKERHIEVIPEIEFPGHACAALAAYPEFSCSPNGSHSVQFNGGVFADVFNVANSATLQFAKDVLDEIIEIFPYSEIHIGGDECPTTAWESNDECLALKEKEGYSHIRELQSRFVRLLADYVRQKDGNKKRNVIMWNESLTAAGTNIELIKGTIGTLMCWESGKVESSALQAAQLGMNSIITPIGPYYINRKQSTDPNEPHGAGYGHDNLQSTYNYVPVPDNVPAGLRKHYIGVQGTFWTEYVESNYLLEYFALPRLIAIAETGWTPANKKNFDDFCRRITADTLLLNYNNYEYGRHYINKNETSGKIMPKSSTDSEKHWYRIVTGATDNRAGKCIELLREGAPQIGTGNAQVNRLWNGNVAAEGDAAYDYQLWAFMEDPDNAGKYALVCKAKPNGSVNSTPTASDNKARWDYDDSKRHYDFILGEAVYTQSGNYYRYSIHSQKAAAGMYMNFAGAGQNNSINMWSDPNDGNGGVWEMRPVDGSSIVTIDFPKQGATVRIANNVDKFTGWRIIDEGKDFVTAKALEYAADVWEVVTATESATGQDITLRNLATGRYINNTSYPLTLGASGSTLKNVYNTRTGDFSINAGSNGAIFPMPAKATANAHTLNVGGIYPQGSAWVYEPVYQITYKCYDKSSNEIGTYYSSSPQGEPYTCSAPTLKNMTLIGYGADGNAEAPTYSQLDGHKQVKAVYEKNAYSVILKYIEERGGIIKIEELSCPIGESIILPDDEELEFYEPIDNGTRAGTSYTPQGDVTLYKHYRTKGICGFRAIGEPVKNVQAGKSYLLFNNKNESARSGYLYANEEGANIMTDNSAASGSPAYIWTIEQSSGEYVKVHNEYELYIPELVRGTANKASKNGGDYLFTTNEDGTLTVKSSNGLYWNGNDNHTFTGWNEAHPFIAYEYYVEPYFNVTTHYVDEEGNDLYPATGRFLKGGELHTIIPIPHEEYHVKEISGANENSNRVTSNMNIVITYAKNTTAIKDIDVPFTPDNTIYNLQGIRIDKPQRGIYIQGGKKVFIR